MRDVVGVAKVDVLAGDWTGPDGRHVAAYVGDAGAIFDDYARAALTVVAKHLGAFAMAEFRDAGPRSPRGAALWDASVHLDSLRAERKPS